jgi:hypothetical protein
MAASPVVDSINRELARRINDEVRGNPQSPYAAKFVGIANGQVVTVDDDLDRVVERLRGAESDPSKTLCFEAGLDYESVEDIWGCR